MSDIGDPEQKTQSDLSQERKDAFLQAAAKQVCDEEENLATLLSQTDSNEFVKRHNKMETIVTDTPDTATGLGSGQIVFYAFKDTDVAKRAFRSWPSDFDTRYRLHVYQHMDDATMDQAQKLHDKDKLLNPLTVYFVGKGQNGLYSFKKISRLEGEIVDSRKGIDKDSGARYVWNEFTSADLEVMGQAISLLTKKLQAL